MKNTIFFTLLLALFLTETSCNQDKRYIYQVEGQELYQNASEKQTLKTTTQFISIAYNDLFSTSITNQELTQFDVTLQAFGDKSVLHDMIVKSLINRGGVQLPIDATMRANIPAFVHQTYLLLYNRQPNDFELWKMTDLISKNTDITVKMIFYSMMTADEYQYY